MLSANATFHPWDAGIPLCSPRRRRQMRSLRSMADALEVMSRTLLFKNHITLSDERLDEHLTSDDPFDAAEA